MQKISNFLTSKTKQKHHKTNILKIAKMTPEIHGAEVGYNTGSPPLCVWYELSNEKGGINLQEIFKWP